MDQATYFVDNKARWLINPHYNALVISLLISNCMIKRVLINNGPSTNVVFLNAFKEMEIDEYNNHRYSTILVDFSSE